MDMKKKYFLLAAAFFVGAVVLFSVFSVFFKTIAPKNESKNFNAGIAVNKNFENNSANLALEEKNEQLVKILAFGDLMLDRNVFSLAKKNNNFEYPFLKIDDFLKGADIRLANLEGPVTEFDSVAVGTSKLQFTFSLKFMEALEKRFEVFSLANNHSLDFGEKGLSQAKEFLSKAKIIFFGDYKNRKEYLSAIIEKNDIKIGLVGLNSLVVKDDSEALAEIANLKAKSDFVIVMPHWGNEYQLKPTASQKNSGHRFIDAGADLVLGGHPHVIEPIEIYKEKVIFYSLGNFIFDQYFSQETMRGLSVGISISKKHNEVAASYELYPLEINKQSQASLASLEITRKILEELSQEIEADGNIKEDIKKGFISLP